MQPVSYGRSPKARAYKFTPCTIKYALIRLKNRTAQVANKIIATFGSTQAIYTIKTTSPTKRGKATIDINRTTFYYHATDVVLSANKFWHLR